MIQQQLPNIYSEALHLLTTGGTAAIKCNNNDGEIFTVETGSGQGDPPSAPRFTTGTDPLTRVLDKVTKDFRYKLNGDTLPVSVFADDNMMPLCIRNMIDFEKIIEIFDDFFCRRVLLCLIESTKCENKFCITLHLRHKLYLVEKSLPSANSAFSDETSLLYNLCLLSPSLLHPSRYTI
jgi:hypothetical protein